MAHRLFLALLLTGCDLRKPSPATSAVEVATAETAQSATESQLEKAPDAPWQPVIEVDTPTDVAPVAAAAAISAPEVHPGESLVLALRVRMAPGWHIYDLGGESGPSQPTSIELGLPEGIVAEGLMESPTPVSQVTAMGLVKVFHSDAVFKQRLTVSTAAKAATHDLICTLHYQACDHTRCLRPSVLKLTVPVEILAPQE